MYENWTYELKMVATLTLLVMFMTCAVSADKVASVTDVKETPNASQNVPSQGEQQPHIVAKRAWQQLQSGWGKRSFDDDPKESLDELQRQIMKLYSNQLLANQENQVDDSDYNHDDYDGPVDKRAWKQMNSAWGKRDWNQLRSNGWGKRETGNWNNMRGLWGKRSPGWNKLQSAWGK